METSSPDVSKLLLQLAHSAECLEIGKGEDKRCLELYVCMESIFHVPLLEEENNPEVLPSVEETESFSFLCNLF